MTGAKSLAGLSKPDSVMGTITKRKRKKKDVSKSMANMNLKKKKKNKETHEHKVNCAAWGCQCKVK
jgi:hypothetical protein